MLLAVELLLFEFRASSLIPVALATATATGIRFALVGSAPAFEMPDVSVSSTSGSARVSWSGMMVGGSPRTKRKQPGPSAAAAGSIPDG